MAHRFALGVALIAVSMVTPGCVRTQVKVGDPTRTHAGEIESRYRELGDLASTRLARARAALDDYCREHRATHFTNLTYVGCGYDLHEERWLGEIIVESTLTLSPFQASFRRVLRFTGVESAWSEAPGGSASHVEGNPPATIRAAMKGFSERLGLVFPRPVDAAGRS